MYVTKNGKPYFPRYCDFFEEFLAIVEPDPVQPFAAYLHRWVVQANHDIGDSCCVNFGLETGQLRNVEMTASLASHATIEADDKPVIA